MRTLYLRLLLIISFVSASYTPLQAQVKIGTNPQNINAASILELESSDKAFVIPRMNGVQMSAITPLEGAMVYNTDEQCLHYYDGAAWINICEAFGANLTFSSEAIENPGNFETINITQTTDTNYNFEVGLLNASNIQDGTMGTAKITDLAITLNKLATNSVNSLKIADRSILAIDIAPGLPNTVLQTNAAGLNVVWAPLDASTVTGRLLSNEQGTSGDTSITVTNGDGATLTNAQLRVTDLGITTIKLADGAVDNSKLALNAVETDNILDATILEADLADNAVTNAKIIDNAIGNTKIQDDAVTTDKIVDDAVTPLKIDATLAGTGLLRDIITGVISVNSSGFDGDGNITSTDLDVTGDTNALLGDIVLNINNVAVTAAKINADVAGEGLEKDVTTGALNVLVDNATIEIDATNGLQVAANGITSTQITNDAITTAKIENLTIVNEDIADRTIALVKLADGGAEGDIIRWDDTAGNWVLANESSLSITEVDGSITNEIQNLDFTAGIITLSNDPTSTTIDLSAYDTNAADDFDGQWGSLVGIPAGFADNIDNDTQLDETTVDAFVANNGFLTAEVDGSITNEIQNLNFTAGIITLSNDPTSTTIDLSAYDSNAADDFDGQWGNLVGIPAGFADNIDNDTQLDEAAVDAFVSNNGFLTSEVDGSITNEIQNLDFTAGIVTLSNDPTSTVIDLSAYDSNAADDFDGQWSSLVGIPAGFADNIDNDTQLDEAAVDAFVSNNGFLTSEVDGSITNEIQFFASSNSSIIATIDLVNNRDYDITIAPISGGAGGLIVDNSITASDLAPDSVDASEIRMDAVGSSEIRTNAVASDEILDGSITNIDINNGAAIDGTKINPNFGAQAITTTSGISVGADILLNGNSVVPDYVFEKYFDGFSALNTEYEFKSLYEIEKFIKANNHLPGITSASQARNAGYWNLSESNLKNLEKIEELFLHTINQEKQIEKLKYENNSLSNELKNLRDEVEAIKAMISSKND